MGVPLLGVTVVLSLVLSACSVQSEDAAPHALQANLNEILQPDPIIDSARNRLISVCLNAAGFDVPEPAPAQGFPGSRFNVVGLLGLMGTPDEAAAMGYRGTVKDEMQPAFDEFAKQFPPESQELYGAARFGASTAPQITAKMQNGAVASVSGEGCHAEAEGELFGSPKTSLDVTVMTNDVLMLANNETVADALADAQVDYRRCMAGRGVEVPAGDTNAEKIAVTRNGVYRDPGVSPNSAERELARVDATCQIAADIDVRSQDAFFTSSADWIRTNSESIESLAAATRAAEVRAREIVG